MSDNTSMTMLSVLPAISFQTGNIKRPNAVNLAALAAGMPLPSLLPVFTYKGYSMRVGSFSPEKITLFVFEETTKDKETKQATVTTINKIVTLTFNAKTKVWQSDSLFDSKATAKLAIDVAKRLWTYPIMPMADAGLYPPKAIVPTLAAIVSTKFDIDGDTSTKIATALIAYAATKPALKASSPAAIINYIETQEITEKRLTAYVERQESRESVNKALAPTSDSL